MAGFLLAAVRFSFHEDNTSAIKVYTVVILVFAFIIPLAIIIFSYVVIFYVASNLLQAANQESLSRELRVAKTISVIIGLFIFCWMPFFVINMLFIFGGDDNGLSQHADWAVGLTKALHYSNSMMNFFVYAVRSPDFRDTFKALVFKCNATNLREQWRNISIAEKKSLRASKNGNGKTIPARYLKNGVGNTVPQETLLPCSPCIDMKLFDDVNQENSD